MIERAVPFLIGLPIFLMGVGMTLAFGIFAFIGMPLLIVGVSLISAAVNPQP